MLKIIVADNAREDLVLANRILQQCKLLNPICLVRSAAECIQELQRMQQHGLRSAEPSLVLLDMTMPQEGSLDVLRYLQNADYRSNCLIVMLTGLQDVKAIHTGYQLGAKTFLLKPLTVMDMAELVNSLSEISIEESEGGYVLHWRDRLANQSEVRRKTTRIQSLSA